VNLKEGFNQYKYDSILHLAPWGFGVYLLLSIIDYTAGGQFVPLLLTRFFFGLPLLISYFVLKNRSIKKINLMAVASLYSIYLGISIVSYQIGGILSDYYFGMVIVSFLQFIFFPFNLITTIALDLAANITFFSINTYSHNYEVTLFIKQISNLLSFLVLKFLAINRFNQLFMSNIQLVEIRRTMESKQRIQKLMGELCHLLNNPMFIAMNFTKKILKTKEIDRVHEYALKSLSSIERMKSVSSEMLKIYDGQESEMINETITKQHTGL